MTVLQLPENHANSQEIRNSRDYYRIANYLNYSTAPVCIKKIRDDSTEGISVDIQALTSTDWPPWYEKLRQVWLQAKREKLVENLIVHGSYGDWTCTNYSDLDLTLLLEDSLLQAPRRMTKLRKWLRNELLPVVLSVDPLQHHGPFFLWQNLTDNYPEDILPVTVYQHAWAMEPVELCFQLLPFPNHRRHAALRTANRLNEATSYFNRGFTMYSMKRYLSNLMLIPTLYCSDAGTPVLKAQSFDSFYKEFGPAALPIRAASALRQDWPPALDRVFRAAQLGCRVKGGLELVRQLYHNESVRNVLNHEIMPHTAGLASELARRKGNADC
ncbi:MAG: hypothetical protein VX837_05045 [Candidatus Thermoplasmatota archaeon]|nr:hypothetical protein [Candidatus Thermoplasmatota archaeon]MEC9353918.1 hypothetical protein [Candidatus Thermoplasmatota archaeon]MEE3207683.1 hypothetical protein [Candidatus Thermoplasmatota archaeon]MEE3276475.1 hypothetical protein [Candidatus Thermoplasmatota archaeon]